MSNLKLIFSIIRYLKGESNNEVLTPDTRESLEVAVQCLLTAYDLESNDPRFKVKEEVSLPALFEKALDSHSSDSHSSSDVTVKCEEANDPVLRAQMMKNIGNEFMKVEMFPEAVRYYTSAIELDGENAIFFCNRAAAHSKLGDFENAVIDCERAVQIDPQYAKAYGRLGLAYVNLNKDEKAVEIFKKALELDPDNESYKSNLKIAVEKVEKEKTDKDKAEKARREHFATATPGPADVLPPVDFRSLFANPVFRNMAASLMQDPNIMSALTASMNDTINQHRRGGRAPSNPNPPPPLDPANLEALYDAGQLLAAQLEAGNPDLAEQIRQNAPRNDSQGPDGSSKK